MNRFGKAPRFILSLFFFLFMVGCSNPEGKSQELFETARFEEQQRNFKHARKLYQEITREYPKTSFAAKAEARLKDLKTK